MLRATTWVRAWGILTNYYPGDGRISLFPIKPEIMIRKAVLFHHGTGSGSRERSATQPALENGDRKKASVPGVIFETVHESVPLTSAASHEMSENEEDPLKFDFKRTPGWDLLFDQNPQPLFVIDPVSRLLILANCNARQLTGFCQGEIPRMGLNDLVIDVPTDLCATDNGILHLRKRNGTAIPVKLRATQLMDDNSLVLVALEAVQSVETKLSTFSVLGHRLPSARTQREAVQILLDAADQFFGWDACTFDYYSAETNLIQPVIVIDRINGERREIEPVVVNTVPTKRMRKVIEEGAELLLRKPPLQMASDSVPIGDRRPSASIMSVPVRKGTSVIGLFSIQSYQLNAYTAQDLELLQTLADYGAGALERIQAQEQVQALNTHLEKRVEERTAALQEAVRELEAFSYSISHDMRAPLRAMEGYTRKLMDEYSGKMLEGKGLEYLSRISRAAVRLDMLIQDVLTYTNVARCQAPLTTVDVEQLLQDLIATYPDWRAPHVKIEVLSPLPAVVANEALLTQCFSHLIDNALKFVKQPISPHVRIWAECREGIVRTSIEDNGDGIDPKDHARVFRLFERIHPASEFAGTGVGLTIVKKAVERMNGSVGFTSELGKGSKFWFELAAPSPL